MDLLGLLCLAYARELAYGEGSVVRRKVDVPGNRKERVAIRPYMLSFPRRLTISVSRGLRAQAWITAFLSLAAESLHVPNFLRGTPPLTSLAWRDGKMVLARKSFLLSSPESSTRSTEI